MRTLISPLTIAILFCNASVCVPAAGAQVPGLSDSTVAAQLAPGIFEAIAHQTAQAALGAPQRAVSVTLPDGEAWRSVERHILAAINGRSQTEADTLVFFVSMQSVRFVSDTLSARLHVGSRWRCADGEWHGHTHGYFLFTVRHRGNSWQGIRSTLETTGSSLACDRMRDDSLL